MTVPNYNQEHAAIALDLFTDQYRGRANLAGFCNTLMASVQDAERMLWEVINGRGLGEVIARVLPEDDGESEFGEFTGDETEVDVVLDCRGAQLDVLGKIIGEARRLRNDADYIVGLKMRIRINSSKGRTSDVTAVAALALPLGTDVGYVEGPEPAAFEVRAYDVPGGPWVARGLGQARAAGTRGVYRHATWPLVESFIPGSRYGSVATATGPTSRYGDVEDAGLIVDILECRP